MAEPSGEVHRDRGHRQGHCEAFRDLDVSPGLGDEWAAGAASSQEKRIYINLIALSPRSTPLSDTLMIVDISQNPFLGDLHRHGESPTFTTSSDLWVFQAGEALRVPHYAALMGLDMAAVSVTNNMTEAWLRERLGLAVHMAALELSCWLHWRRRLRDACGSRGPHVGAGCIGTAA